MLEVVKSKMMLVCALLLLSIVFVNAGVTKKLEESPKAYHERAIAMNIR